MHSQLEQLFSGKRLLVVGLGASNVSLLKYLSHYNVQHVTVTDLMNEPDDAERIQRNIDIIKNTFPLCEFVLGNHNVNLDTVDIVVKSPSVSEKTPFIQEIRKNNLPVETDVSLFFRIVPREKIIGITGTKGKSTTSTLMYKVLMDQGCKVTLSGNIGIPFFEKLDESLEADFVVTELSSFMTFSLHEFRLSPKYMAVTSLSQDHLDFHGTFETYIKDKLSILKDQKVGDYAFINADSMNLLTVAPQYVNNPYLYSEKDVAEIVRTKLRGRHNLANIACVYSITKQVLGERFNQHKFQLSVKDFEPLYSRMETRLSTPHCEYINNSKATDPEAFCVDLKTLIDEGKNIYILCGGEDKGLDLTEMVALLSSPSVKCIALFNDKGGIRLGSDIKNRRVRGYYQDVTSAFNDINATIKKSPKKNNVLILMPGTGSYGIFKNKIGSDTFNNVIELLKSGEKSA